MSKLLLGHQEGDALAPLKKSPQDELARFQLLKERMMIRSLPADQISASARAVLGAMSEIQLLQMDIATKLSTDPAYSQSTAAYEQLVRLSGETSYIDIAEYLATQIYEMKRGQYILSQFTPDGNVISKLATGRVSGEGGFLGGLGKAVVEALGGSSSSSS